MRQPHQPIDAVYREKHIGRLASLAFLRLAADEVHLRQRQRVALEELVVILAIIEDGARPEVPVVTVVVVDTAVCGVEVPRVVTFVFVSYVDDTPKLISSFIILILESVYVFV